MGKGRTRFNWAIIFMVGLLLCFALFICSLPRFLPPLPTPTPGVTPIFSSWCQPYFTIPLYPDRPEFHRGGIDEELVALIESAQESIDVAVYDFDLKNVAQALIEAQKRGVTVRLVTDTDNLRTEAIKMLQEADIPIVDDHRGGYMHNKFMVVDGEKVWTGSWNFTENDTYRYNNNAVLITSPQLARNYNAKFKQMFDDGLFGPRRRSGNTTPVLTIQGVRVENYFAPEDEVASKIIAHLEEARESIRFMAFSFTHDGIGQVVREKFEQGLLVQGVFEAVGSESPFSEYGAMKELGMDVLQDGNPYLMHHKVFILDERTVIFGSFNFSRHADEQNDENVLIIEEPELARIFLEEFERVYERARYR